MRKMKKYSGRTWMRVHILYPLIPFLLDGIIRFLSSQFQFSLGTFSASTLAMSVALLSVFVNQSLLTSEPILPNSDNAEDVLDAANQFITYAIFGFAAFSIIVLLTALKEFYSSKFDVDTLQSIKSIFEYAVYFFVFIPIKSAIKAQRAFKLKATI
jgi:hypothetical protein